MWYLAPYTFTLRHAITAIFSAGIIIGSLLLFVHFLFMYVFIGSLFLYGILAVMSSSQQARRYDDIRLMVILPFCFFGFHFIHGLGVLKGCLLLIFGNSPVQQGE